MSYNKALSNKSVDNIRYYKQYEKKSNEKVEYIIETYDKEGEIIWTKKWEKGEDEIGQYGMGSEVALENNKMFFSIDCNLYAINVDDGELLWSGSGGTTKPFIKNGRIYVAIYESGILRCLDTETGQLIWEKAASDDFYWAYDVFLLNDNIAVRFESEDKIIIYNENGDIVDIVDNFYNHPTQPSMWDKIEASSILKSNTGKYDVYNVNDNNSSTAWVEGADGYGLGEWILMKSNDTKNFKFINIKNGYHKTSDTFKNNAYIKTIKLEFGNGSYLIYNFDEIKNGYSFNEEEIKLTENIETDYLKITILDVYCGRLYEDTCISEILTY